LSNENSSFGEDNPEAEGKKFPTIDKHWDFVTPLRRWRCLSNIRISRSLIESLIAYTSLTTTSMIALWEL
jgi:hypothetical protein